MANRLALLLVLALALLAGHAWAGCTSPNAATGAINLSGTAYQYCNGTSWVAFNPTVSTTTCVSTGQMKAFPDGYIYVCDGSHWNNYATGSSKGACATASQLSFAGSHVCTCNGSQLIPWCLASESGGGGTGAAYTFGDNTFGQLGTGDANPYATVQQVTSTTTIPFTGLSMGSVANSCGVDSNGKAYCWGSDIFETGALGNGAVGNVEPYPVRVVSTTAISYSTISTGINFSCALDITGKAYCWGDNSNGQLGNGSAVPSATVPVRVSNPTGSTFAQVANGPNGVCAVTADHNLWCWGLYLDLVSYTTPQQVTSATTISYKQVSTGYDHVCAVDTSGKAYCWGGSDYGTSGELGDGNSTDYAFPVRVISGTAISYTQISAGENYSCALDKNGKAYCWGDNSSGQLGNGNTTGQAVPVLVSASGVSFTSITASGLGYLGGYILTGSPGGNTTCGTATTGDIYCWGYLNSAGLGSTTGLLKQLATPPSFTQVAAGNVGTCGVDGDGKAWCWGYGGNGEIGNGGTADQTYPTQVISSTSISYTQVTSGGNVAFAIVNGLPVFSYYGFSCGLDKNAKAYCWGTGTDGELGYGGTISQTKPVRVVTSTNISFTQISAGAQHTCAVDKNSLAYCWGYNGFSQLGNGNTTSQPKPIKVTSATTISYTQISTGLYHTCALDKNGKAYCWGDNTNKALGIGTPGTQSRPYKLTSPSTAVFTNIYAGALYSCAVDSNNRAYCWGSNANNQLGNGSGSDQSWPVQVNAPGVSFTQVTGGNAYTCALDKNKSIYCWGQSPFGTSTTTPILISDTGSVVSFSSITGGLDWLCAMDTVSNTYCVDSHTNPFRTYSVDGGGGSAGSSVPTKITLPGVSATSITTEFSYLSCGFTTGTGGGGGGGC